MEEKHSTLRIWAALMFLAIALSSALYFWDASPTGLLSFDTGQDISVLSPDFIEEQDFYSHAGNTIIMIFGVMTLQVLIYLLVTRLHYGEDE